MKSSVTDESEINGSDLFKSPLRRDEARWIAGVKSPPAADIDRDSVNR